MNLENVSILSVERVDAPNRITSASIMEQLAPCVERLGLSGSLLQDLTGIVARRWWDPDVKYADMATEAGRKAIEAAGIESRQIGMLISTAVSREYVEPSTACMIHGDLGLSADCRNFDICNACLGFLDGMDQAGMMIERGDIDYAIIVDGEGSRGPAEKTIERLNRPETDEKEFRANFATLTLGSGAAAMVLGRADRHPEGHRYLGGVSLAATEHSRLCAGTMEGMRTRAKTMMIAGAQLGAQTYARACEVMDWGPQKLDLAVIHQVTRAHTEAFAGMAGVPMDRIPTIYQEFGNIGPAGIPTVLQRAVEGGTVQKGWRIGLMGVGSGLNSTMAEVVW